MNDYVVQKDDTLESLAVKFDVPVHRIMKLNHMLSRELIPGTKLVIKQAKKQQINQIDVSLRGARPINGRLKIYGIFLKFIDYKGQEIVSFDLTGYLDTSIQSLPCIDIDDPKHGRMMVTATITYLSIVGDPTSVETIEFLAEHNELVLFLSVMDEIARGLQKDINYTPPKADHLFDGLTEAKLKGTKRKEKESVLSALRYDGPPSELCTNEQITKIRRDIYSQKSLRLKYKLSADGCSYTSFYSKVRGASPCIVIISTTNKEILGFFTKVPLENRENTYGTGDSFVFSFNGEYHSYRWSRKNTMFLFSNDEEISVGGGGSAAIWIDSNFHHGLSERCETYNSPPLTTSKFFDIADIEVFCLA